MPTLLFQFAGARRAALGLLAAATPALAQVPLNPVAAPAPADTTHKLENPLGVVAPTRRPFFHKKLVKALIVLIGYGAYIFNGGFYTNQEARRDVHRLFPSSQTRAADYLIFAPYLELGVVALAGVPSRNDRLNVLLLIAKSEAIMLASTFAVKYISREERPAGSDNLSFPSGHTAQAFWPPASCTPSCATKASGTAWGPTRWPPAWAGCGW